MVPLKLTQEKTYLKNSIDCQRIKIEINLFTSTSEKISKRSRTVLWITYGVAQGVKTPDQGCVPKARTHWTRPRVRTYRNPTKGAYPLERDQGANHKPRPVNQDPIHASGKVELFLVFEAQYES
jgi:hypothetical protein